MNRLSLVIVAMEHFGSFPEAPLKRVLRLLATADFVVLLIGRASGSLVPDMDVPYVVAEFRAARHWGKPILVYVREPGGSLDADALHPAMQQMIEEAKACLGVSAFSSESDLAWKVSCDLARELLLLQGNPDATEAQLHRTVLGKSADDLSRLATYFRSQASQVLAYLGQADAHGSLSSFIAQFRSLHEAHMDQLTQGDLLGAHLTLTQIIRLLDEAGTSVVSPARDGPNALRYSGRALPPAVRRVIVSCYFAGLDIGERFSPYDLLEIYDVAAGK